MYSPSKKCINYCLLCMLLLLKLFPEESTSYSRIFILSASLIARHSFFTSRFYFSFVCLSDNFCLFLKVLKYLSSNPCNSLTSIIFINFYSSEIYFEYSKVLDKQLFNDSSDIYGFNLNCFDLVMEYKYHGKAIHYRELH